MVGVMGSGFSESSYRWGLEGTEHSHIATVCSGGKGLFIHLPNHCSLLHSFTHSDFSSFTLSPINSIIHPSIHLLPPSPIHSFSTDVLSQPIL